MWIEIYSGGLFSLLLLPDSATQEDGEWVRKGHAARALAWTLWMSTVELL